LREPTQTASERAVERGRAQLGTLGSGNHFVEVGYVAEVFDETVARTLGLWKDQATIIIHTGSRGLGHQVCDDYIRVMLDAARKYQIELPDPQLCCAPVSSPEGKRYLEAMACAANFAFTNRQMITHWVRETFEQVFHKGPRDLKLDLIYDVCHNIAKIETHTVNGKKKKLCVHRKGATGPSLQTIQIFHLNTNPSANPSSSQGIWVDVPMYWWGQREPWKRPLGAPAMEQAG